VSQPTPQIAQLVQKLLALAANNPNREEAAAAYQKALELMQKYGLRIDVVGDGPPASPPSSSSPPPPRSQHPQPPPPQPPPPQPPPPQPPPPPPSPWRTVWGKSLAWIRYRFAPDLKCLFWFSVCAFLTIGGSYSGELNTATGLTMWAMTGLLALGLSFLPRKGRLGVWLAVGWVALLLYHQPPAAQPAQPSASADSQPAAQPARPMSKEEEYLKKVIREAHSPEKEFQLTNTFITKWKQAGFSDDGLIANIRAHPANYSLQHEDLTALQKAGISQKVIAAMIKKQTSPDARFDCIAASEALRLREKKRAKKINDYRFFPPHGRWQTWYDSQADSCYASDIYGNLSGDGVVQADLRDAFTEGLVAEAIRREDGSEYGTVFYGRYGAFDTGRDHAAFVEAKTFIEDRMKDK
jgi:hypothetical protein